MTARTVGLWLLSIGVVAVVLAGCHQSSTTDDGSSQPRHDEAECEIDADCDSYYRCIDDECAVPPAMTGETDDQTPVATFQDRQGDEIASFYLELAVTEQEQSRGLMHRPEIEPDWGMLFVYDDEKLLSFWMKNTLISLDMIFVGADGRVVGIVEEAEPETTDSRGVGEPARYVLEVNGGLAAEHGIEPGAVMRLENVEQSHQPDN